MEHIEHTGQEFLTQEAPIEVRSYLSLRGHQRLCFLKWFSEQVDHPLSYQIALLLDEKDWKKLAEQVPSFDKRAVEWLIQVTARAARVREWKQRPGDGDSTIALFYMHAKEYVAKVPESDFKRWAAQFSGVHLCQYFSCIGSVYAELPTGKLLVKALCEDHFPTVIDWIKEIIAAKKEMRVKAREQLDTWIALVTKNEMLSQFSHGIVQHNDPAVALTVLCAGAGQWKKTLLRQYVSLGLQGVEMLAQGIVHLLNQPSGDRSSVEVELPKFFDPFLKEIDAGAHAALRNRLQDLLQDVTLSNASQAFLRILFPPATIEVSDAAGRYQRALEQLKHTLSLTNSSYEERKSVSSYCDDLRQGDKTAAWFVNLCGQIPEHLWPLLFLHFGDRIPSKTTYKRIDGELTLVHNVNALTDLQQDQFVELCAKALNHTIGNPTFRQDGFNTEASWCVNHIVDIIRKYKLEKRVMCIMLEIVPPERFILVMNLFARQCFEKRREEFYPLLVECMKGKSGTMVDYIARCLAAYYSSKEQERYSGFCNLERDFWEDKILESHEMRVELASEFFRIMGMQFVGYALKNTHIFRKIVNSLQKCNPPYTLELFELIITLLIKANNAVEFKLASFNQLMRDFDDQGIDVLEILKQPAYAQCCAAIREWYHIPHAELYCPVKELNLRLAHHFTTPEGGVSSGLHLYDGLVKKIVQSHMDQISKKEWEYIYRLFEILDVLQKLNCGEEAVREIEGNTEWMELLKQNFEKNPTNLLIKPTHPSHVDLLLKWLPHWKERLKDHLMGLINEALQRSSSLKTDCNFHSAKAIYQDLHPMNLLPEFMAYVEQGAAGKVKKALEDLREAVQNPSK